MAVNDSHSYRDQLRCEGFVNWMADKEAEYRLSGFNKKDAKEKAMADWYQYGMEQVEKHIEQGTGIKWCS